MLSVFFLWIQTYMQLTIWPLYIFGCEKLLCDISTTPLAVKKADNGNESGTSRV